MKTYEKDIKQLAFETLCDMVCDRQNSVAVRNCLCRNGISSIDDLKKQTLYDISRFRSIGDKRMVFIKELKNIVDNEEKTQYLLELDDDYRRLSKNGTRNELYVEMMNMDCAGYGARKIARELGLRERTVHLFVW